MANKPASKSADLNSSNSIYGTLTPLDKKSANISDKNSVIKLPQTGGGAAKFAVAVIDGNLSGLSDISPATPRPQIRDTMAAKKGMQGGSEQAGEIEPAASESVKNNAVVGADVALVQTAQTTQAPIKINKPASKLLLPASVLPSTAPNLTAAEPPVSGIRASTIKFGIIGPFSGPSRDLGQQMKIGIESAFNEANKAGGINGRTLTLVSADDGYDPKRTGAAMQQLAERDKIFAYLGNVGTPTAVVALPYANQNKLPYLGAFTGTSLLRRDPPDRYVFNFRASYAEETAATVHYLIKVRHLQPSQIVVFAQNDAFGDAGYAGVTKAFRGLSGNYADPIRLSYERNTIDVDKAVAQLRARRFHTYAVIMIATYRAAARFIELSHSIYPAMIYTNVSFVGSTSLADELKLHGKQYVDKVIVTQVVPSPNSDSSFVLKYRAALAASVEGETPDYVSLEGYIDGQMAIAAVKLAGPNVDADKLANALETLHGTNMGVGTPLALSADDHQASHKVWGSQLDQNGIYHEIDLE